MLVIKECKYGYKKVFNTLFNLNAIKLQTNKNSTFIFYSSLQQAVLWNFLFTGGKDAMYDCLILAKKNSLNLRQ